MYGVAEWVVDAALSEENTRSLHVFKKFMESPIK